MKPLLIIQADDVGVHPQVDQAALDAVDSGCITSLGFLVSGDTSDAVAEAIRARGPGVGLSLQLALTRLPALADSRLAQKGQPLPGSWRNLARRLARGAVRREDLALEVRAQVRRARALGIPIDHVDSHEHVHLMPGVADVVAKVMREEGLAQRVRITRTPRGELAKDARAVALRAAASFSRRTAWKGFASPDRVVGVAEQGAHADFVHALDRVSADVRSIELIVHAARPPAPEQPPLPQGGEDWIEEGRMLFAQDWSTFLARRYVLGTYRDL